MRKLAFTLSEVLVTLGIIGVVAVLTVPNLTKNINTKSDIATLQSTLKNINDSVKTMMVNERVTYISDSPLGVTDYLDPLNGYFNKYLKVNSVCDDLTNCFVETYKTITGDNINFESLILGSLYGDNQKACTLPSGVSLIYMDVGQQFVYLNEYFKGANGDDVSLFIVDVNGVKPPNVIGVDMFTFAMDDRGNVGYFGAIPEDVDGWNDLRATCRSGEDYGLSCAYLLQTGDWDAKIISTKYADEE